MLLIGKITKKRLNLIREEKKDQVSPSENVFEWNSDRIENLEFKCDSETVKRGFCFFYEDSL